MILRKVFLTGALLSAAQLSFAEEVVVKKEVVAEEKVVAEVVKPAAPKIQTLPLKISAPTTPNGYSGMQYVRFNKNLEGSFKFATASQKVNVKVQADGKLLVDKNGDGKFDATDGAALSKGGSFTIPIMFRGKSYNYPLTVVSVSKRYLTISSKACLTTKHGETTISLLDSNVNGVFGEYGRDSIEVGSENSRMLKVNLIGDKFHFLKVSKGGKSLLLADYTGTVGLLELDLSDKLTAAAVSITHVKTGYSTQVRKGKKTKLLAGDYRVNGTSLYFENESKQKATLIGRYEKSVILKIKAGKNSYKFGLPLKLDFKASNTNGMLNVSWAGLRGTGGEVYKPNVYGVVRSTLYSYIKSGALEKPLKKLGYG